MATITGLTKEKMLEIEAASVVDGEIRADGHLWLIQHDGNEIDAGSVTGPQGPPGPVGPASISSIPGEVKLWPGSTLPAAVDYGKWVWADGAVYVVATYPKAAAHIAPQWRTFAGASDPGASNFRVPDLRGLVPAGLDQMPGGTRANRMTRAVAIVIAGRTGEETHVITIPEMPNHDHGGGNHAHGYGTNTGSVREGGGDYIATALNTTGLTTGPSGNIISPQGGNGAHENVQPTVFVPYIVKLDD